MKFVVVDAAEEIFPVLSPASLLYVVFPQINFLEPAFSFLLEFISSILTVFSGRHPIPDLVHALIPSFFI